VSRIPLFCPAVALSVCMQVAWAVAAEQPVSPGAQLEKSLQIAGLEQKAAQAGDTEVSIQNRWSGSYCGVRTAGERVIRDADAWKSLWGQVGRIRKPAPAPPEVDFSKQVALAVFMGQRNSGGYSIRITSVRDTDQEVVVQVKRTSPPPGAMVTMALTQPYDIVTIARSGKPIKFETAAAGKPHPNPGKRFEKIEVQQSGGFAGVANRYVIRGSGSFEFERSRPRKSAKGELPAKELAALSFAVGRQDWTKLPGKLHTPGVADVFMYEITVQTSGKTYRVVCDDLSASKSPALKAIIRALAVIQSGKARGVPVPPRRRPVAFE